MEFCPKCDSLLVPKKDKDEIVLACSSCKYKKRGGATKIVEKTEGLKKIEAVDDQANTLPVTKTECPECGNKKAYFRSEQTRAADEPETLFFTCTKCSKIWREYE